jgi:hypothetical protein
MKSLAHLRVVTVVMHLVEVLQVCTFALEPFRHNLRNRELFVGVLDMQVGCCVEMT